MNTIGIIAEYNPFHNGHQYQLEQIRKLTGADYIVIAMSGNFVQRGEPAVYDKYTRTRIALSAGADLVIEIPALFAASSAEDFAACGVSLLEQLGVVNGLCFGSECGEIPPLMQAAKILAEEPEEYTAPLKQYLKQGKSFPQARLQALTKVNETAAETIFSLPELLSSPNNILGIEYLKALHRRGSSIQPFTIRRQGHSYHDSDITEAFASATALRKAIAESGPAAFLTQMPDFACPILTEATPVFPDDCSLMLNYQILKLVHSGTDLTAFLDVSAELADRIYCQYLQFDTFTGRIQSLKTKQYTYTRISRVLLHLLLEITAEQAQAYRRKDYASYVRILGFRKQAGPLLRQIKEHASLPLVTKIADAERKLTGDARQALRQDLYCSHLYQAIVRQKNRSAFCNEYTHPIVII